MRRILLALVPALLMAMADVRPAVAEGVVFLVRHAEKSLEIKGDAAPLLPEGEARARTLADMLADAGITELVTSDALRSRQTAGFFTDRTRVPAQVMTREEEVAYAARLRDAPDGKNRLIVAHVRNIPKILAALGVAEAASVELDAATDFNNLFVVQTYSDRPATMVWLHYETAAGK